MPKRIIQMCYRKIIDNTQQQPWEKLVFDDSYTEFLMQAQFFNQQKKYNTFSELVMNVPGADKLHFLVSASVIGYVRQLNDTIPDILNNLGKHFLPFKNFRFEIINSDIRNKAAHQVAINFYSEPLIWHDTIDNSLLVSLKKEEPGQEEVFTEMFQLRPMLSIYSLKSCD
ncbi:MAG: hypothetical protein JWQ09_5462 [Segetibacter sp.]|nr:hypothetical protein [Segetibacter sp.]